MPEAAAPSSPTLILCPTQREADAALPTPLAANESFALCGVGPVGAAATCAALLAQQAPARVVLIGIAGTYAPKEVRIGSAYTFSSVRIDGVGVGEGQDRLSLEALDFDHAHDLSGRPVGHALSLDPLAGSSAGELLTVCAVAADRDAARERSARFRAARAEDMEGFGVALACAREGVPLTVIRGISNVAGDRDHAQWSIEPALAAAREMLEALRA